MKALWSLVAVLTLAPASSLAGKVDVDFDETAAFSGYKTYMWEDSIHEVQPDIDLRCGLHLRAEGTAAEGC